MLGMNNPHLAKVQNIYVPQWRVQNVLAFTTTRIHPTNNPPSNPKNNPTNRPTNSSVLGSIYPEFNLGTHVGDNNDSVEVNRQFLTQCFRNNTQIQWLNQVHGDQVANITQVSQFPITADASVTREKNVALAIMTADCLPMLLSAHDGSVIAAIHGGWRSLLAGIISKSIAQMATKSSNISAWLGPCIGRNAFEVGQEVRQAFIQVSQDFELAFKEISPDKYLADLHLIATIELKALGIVHISSLEHCTFSMSDDYYSYRREGQTGRMATLICRD